MITQVRRVTKSRFLLGGKTEVNHYTKVTIIKMTDWKKVSTIRNLSPFPGRPCCNAVRQQQSSLCQWHVYWILRMSARSLGHEVGPEMGHSTNACVTLEDEDRDPECTRVSRSCFDGAWEWRHRKARACDSACDWRQFSLKKAMNHTHTHTIGSTAVC